MSIYCTICSDIFTGVHPEVVHTTLCGHIFHIDCLLKWLERSNTCPQCRSVVNEKRTVRLYFQIPSQVAPEEGLESLENRVQSLNFQVILRDMDIKKFSKENNQLKIQNKELKTKISKAEEEIRNHQTIVSSYSEHIKVLKMEVKSLSELKHKAEYLEGRLETYSHVDKILRGTLAETTEALQSMKGVTDLGTFCLLITNLKKEISSYKMKHLDLQNNVQALELKLALTISSLKSLKDENSSLERSLQRATKDLRGAEAQTDSIRKKCDILQEAVLSSNKGDADSVKDIALRRFINEYPPPAIDIMAESEQIHAGTAQMKSRSPSPPSPQIPQRYLLNGQPKNRLSSTSSCVSYDGLAGHPKDEPVRTEKSELLRIIANRKKSNKLGFRSKRRPIRRPDLSANCMQKYFTNKSVPQDRLK